MLGNCCQPVLFHFENDFGVHSIYYDISVLKRTKNVKTELKNVKTLLVKIVKSNMLKTKKKCAECVVIDEQYFVSKLISAFTWLSKNNVSMYYKYKFCLLNQSI